MNQNFKSAIIKKFFSLIITLSSFFLAQSQVSHWESAFPMGIANLSIVDENFAIFINNYLYGLITINRDTLIPAQYDKIELIPEIRKAIVRKDHKYGVIDFYSGVVLPLQYNYVNYSKEKFVVGSEDKTCLFDHSGKIMFQWLSKELHRVDIMHQYLVIKDNHLFLGLKTFDGQMVLPCNYEEIRILSSDTFLVKKGQQYLILDKGGNVLNEISCIDVLIHVNKKAYITVENYPKHKIHYFNGELQSFDEFTIDQSNDFHIGRIQDVNYLFNRDFEIIDSIKDGVITKLKFPNNIFTPFKSLENPSLYEVFDNKKQFVKVWDNETKIIEGYYNSVRIYGKYIVASKDNLVDIYDLKGKLVESIIAEEIHHIENVLIVKLNETSYLSIDLDLNKTSIIDDGKLYKMGSYFYSHHPKSYSQYKIYSNKGEFIMSCDEVDRILYGQDNGEEIIVYNVEGKKGWISKDFIEHPKYSQVHYFSNGSCLAKKGNDWGLVSKSGKVILNFTFSDMKFLNYSNIFALKLGEYWSIYENNSLIDSARHLEQNLNLFYYGSLPNLKTITEKGRKINLKIRSHFQDELVCRMNDCKLYLKQTNYEEYLTFDTVYSIDHEFVGKRKDTLYYFDKYSNVAFAVKGVEPLGKHYINYKYYKTRDSIVVVNECGINVYNRAFTNINKLDNKDILFCTIENGEALFFNKYSNVFKTNSDSIFQIDRDIVMLWRSGNKFWYSLKDNIAYPAPGRSIKYKDERNFIGKDFLLYDILLDHKFKVVYGPSKRIYAFINPEYFVVEDGNTTTLINSHGEIVIPPDIYQGSFTLLGKNLVKAVKKGYVGIYNIKEKKWYPADKFQDIKSCNVRIPLAGELFTFRKDGKFGVMDENCNIVLENHYAGLETQGVYLILYTNHHIKKIYHIPSRTLMDFEFENFRVSSVEDNLIVIKTKDQHLKIRDTTVIAKSYYKYILTNWKTKYSYFTDDNGLMGILDENFEVYIEAKFDNLTTIRNDLIVGKLGEKYGIFNQSGQTLLPFEFQNIKELKNQYYQCRIGDKYVIYNSKTQTKYDDLIDSCYAMDDFLILRKQDAFMIKNLYYKSVLSIDAEDVEVLGHDFFGIKREGLWQICNNQGEFLRIEGFRYVCNVTGYPPGCLVIQQGDKSYKYFDFTTTETRALKAKDYYAHLDERAEGWKDLLKLGVEPLDHLHGYFVVVQNERTGLQGLANALGEIVVDCKYDGFQYLNQEYFFGMYKLNNKYGFITENMMFLPNTYDEIEILHNPDRFRATKGNKIIIINTDGAEE